MAEQFRPAFPHLPGRRVAEAARLERRDDTGGVELGLRGGNSTRERHGPEFYHQTGKKGGEVVLQRLGPEHFSEMGKKGGRKTKELLEQGRAAQADDRAEQQLRSRG